MVLTLAQRLLWKTRSSFKLTRSVNADRVSATYRDGVLEVRIPKAEEARMREIEVQVG